MDLIIRGGRGGPRCLINFNTISLLNDTKRKKMKVRMATASFALSANGLAHIPFKESRNDFEFIVGDAIYRCPSLIADFLFPRIASLHSIDHTMTSFVIETADHDHKFAEFLSLGHEQ
jgi:hypothetical protein